MSDLLGADIEKKEPKNCSRSETFSDVGLHQKIIAFDDKEPNTYYPVDKLEAHINNIPHIAVSLFVFDGDNLLLQQRANTKYHSGGLWSNSMCSHPIWLENTEDCAKRRMNEELGWTLPLTNFGTIRYTSKVGRLYENESAECFFSHYDNKKDLMSFNRQEVSAVKWINMADIRDNINARPNDFTEWFKIYMQEHFELINNSRTK